MNRPLLLIALSLALMLPKIGRAGDWTQRSVSLPRPTAMPPSHEWFPADFLELVYDSWRRVTVGLGGHANPPLYYLAVSEYDGVNWVSRYTGSASNTPTFRSVGGATFDSWRGVTVVFGGWIGSHENSNNELWEYNGNQWTQRTWSGPGPRNSSSARLCFDPFRGRTIGLTGSPLPNTYETWEWTGSAWDRAPDLSGVGGVAMVFDESRNRAFVYTNEPLNGLEDLEEAYEFIPGTTAAQGVWQHVPGDVPSVATLGASLVYDPYRQRVLRHGGRSAADIYAYEIGTFAWNPATARWNIVGGLPDSGRAGAGICYDRHRVMTVLYGGIRIYVEDGSGRTTQYADTWEYTDNVPGDTWVDFAYAGVETGSPQQPLNTLSEALTYAPPSGRIYLKSGTSPQTLNSAAFRSTPVTIYAWEGSATIGN